MAGSLGVEPGDLMRISVALLRQLYDEPEHTSVLVELLEVKMDADGSKVLLLKRVSPESLGES